MVRVVAGDGTGDRALARAVPGVAAEWQPGAPFVGAVAGQKVLRTGNTLAVSGPDGRVRAIDVSTGQALWTAAADSPARFLSWAGDGAHLLAGGALGGRVLDVVGRVAARIRMPAGAVATEAAFAPQGSRIALVRRRPGGVSELVLVDGGRQRLLFAGAGRLSGLKWSPDGRWLLVSWPPSDQFLFVRATGLPRVEAVARVGSEFNPRARGAAGAALPAGWCCSRP
jgi:hypothetical protein